MWFPIMQAAVAYSENLAAWPPEKRRAYVLRMQEQRENELLESFDEVLLARQYIADDGLRGEFAEQLLAFARHLARRRMN